MFLEHATRICRSMRYSELYDSIFSSHMFIGFGVFYFLFLLTMLFFFFFLKAPPPPDFSPLPHPPPLPTWPVAVPHQRPPGPEPRHEDVDTVERLRDLGAGAVVVCARVRLVPVLEGHEVARVAFGELEREAHSSVRALVAGRVDDLGAVQAEKAAPLLGGVLRHDARQRVALELGDEREGDTRVAARRLEQPPAGLERTARLGRLDHRLGDTILDRARRVLALELRVEADALPGRDARQLDERRVADEREQRGRGPGSIGPAGAACANSAGREPRRDAGR